MKRGLRLLGGTLVVLGIGVVLWTLVVWRWQDPFSALYTKVQQGRLEREYEHRAADYEPPRVRTTSFAAVRRVIAREARSYRLATHRGQGIGRIVVPRLDLNMVVVDGTDEASLKKGPGRDQRTFVPGEGRLVYLSLIHI